jgi:hypothetical protein
MSIIAASRLRAAGINPMFDNAVAYYRLDETTGDAIDLVNAYNGTLNGSIARDGEFYTFNAETEYVEIADEDDFSFTDGSGNNQDFVIKTEVIFDAFNANDRGWLVSKRSDTSSGVQEWQLIYFSNALKFYIWSSSNVPFSITFYWNPNINQKYIIGVTLNAGVVSLFIDGFVTSKNLPVGFTFFNGPSKVKLGDETFDAANLNLLGKMKETVIIKGNGWTDQNITDNYNGGAGITY